MPGLLGKVIIIGEIEAVTGLRIGGSSTGLKIGGVDLNVITDAYGKPYIPGSSLKGKTRHLAERLYNRLPNEKGLHLCEKEDDYKNCPVCRLWGILGTTNFSVPTLTRLIFQDVPIREESITEEMRRNMDLHWTEVKWETAIDRRTGTVLHGSLRQVERVPAGAIFGPMRILVSLYEKDDVDLLKTLFESMALLEDDYLGGMGSRGYGQVQFRELKIIWKSAEDYRAGKDGNLFWEGENAKKLVKNFDDIKKKIDIKKKN